MSSSLHIIYGRNTTACQPWNDRQNVAEDSGYFMGQGIDLSWGARQGYS